MVGRTIKLKLHLRSYHLLSTWVQLVSKRKKKKRNKTKKKALENFDFDRYLCVTLAGVDMNVYECGGKVESHPERRMWQMYSG